MEQFALMASNRVQKCIEHGEEVKANLAALIDSHLLGNSDGQPNLDETTDVCTDSTRKRARKLTAVMWESQEQQKKTTKTVQKAPAEKHLKVDMETDHIDSQSNQKNKGKQPRKRSVKSRVDKSKETR